MFSEEEAAAVDSETSLPLPSETSMVEEAVAAVSEASVVADSVAPELILRRKSSIFHNMSYSSVICLCVSFGKYELYYLSMCFFWYI